MLELTERLKELRGASSQAEMARQLDIKQPQWARYESGASFPSVEMLEKICRIHACSADWLLGLPKSAAKSAAHSAAQTAAQSAAPGSLPACAKCYYKQTIEAIANATPQAIKRSSTKKR